VFLIVSGVYGIRRTGDSLNESEHFANSEVELRRVGGVNVPVVSPDPIYSFLCC